MKNNNSPEVIALVNSYHSLEGSDFGEVKEVQKAIKFCNDRVFKLTGKTVNQLPGNLSLLIKELSLKDK